MADCLSVCMSLSLSLSLSFAISLALSNLPFPTSQSISPSVCSSVCLSVLSLSRCLSLAVSICLSVSLRVFFIFNLINFTRSLFSYFTVIHTIIHPQPEKGRSWKHSSLVTATDKSHNNQSTNKHMHRTTQELNHQNVQLTIQTRSTLRQNDDDTDDYDDNDNILRTQGVNKQTTNCWMNERNSFTIELDESTYQPTNGLMDHFTSQPTCHIYENKEYDENMWHQHTIFTTPYSPQM